MSPAVLRLGLVGCGRVAEERHVPALARTRGIRVEAVADTDRARAERLGDRLGVAHRFGDYRALVERRELDVVAVLTPTSSHAEIAGAALEAGKHVLVEKPLALDAAECDGLIAQAARSSAKVAVAFNLRQHRLVREARAVIESGVLGRIKAIHSVYTHDRTGEGAPPWHRKLALGGGVTFNEAVHHFDLWRFLLAAEVEEVFCTSRPSPVYEDETSTVTATLSNGVLATGLFTLRSSPTSDVEIYGEAGRLHLSCYRFDGLAFHAHTTYPGDVRDRVRKALASFRALPEAAQVLRRGGDFQDAFRGLWQHFVDCIREDRSPECTLVDGARAVEIARACLASAGSGRAVPVRVTR